MMKHCHSCWWFKRWYICSCPVSISWNGFVVVFFRMLLFWKVFRCICQHFCRFSGKSRLVFFWTFIDLFWCGGHWWEKNLLCSLESWLLLCKALWGESEKPSVSASCKMLIHPCFSTMWWLQWFSTSDLAPLRSRIRFTSSWIFEIRNRCWLELAEPVSQFSS